MKDSLHTSLILSGESTFPTWTAYTSFVLVVLEQQFIMKSSLDTWSTSRNWGESCYKIMYKVKCLTTAFIYSIYTKLFLFFYSRVLSYTTGHIWACPPSEGDDYIFHCHPMDQKIPKPKRLQEWYKKMLDKAVAERIVHDYKVNRTQLCCCFVFCQHRYLDFILYISQICVKSNFSVFF